MYVKGRCNMQQVVSRVIQTPIDELFIAASDEGLTHLLFVDNMSSVPDSYDQPHTILDQTSAQLEAYFAGELQEFDIPVAPKGTEFQQKVWQVLQTIPYGDHRSYSDLANSLNNPKAVRAVGAANGQNPISIIIPCHRVIGKNGSLTGYAGGLERKQWLLALETKQAQLL